MFRRCSVDRDGASWYEVGGPAADVLRFARRVYSGAGWRGAVYFRPGARMSEPRGEIRASAADRQPVAAARWCHGRMATMYAVSEPFVPRQVGFIFTARALSGQQQQRWCSHVAAAAATASSTAAAVAALATALSTRGTPSSW